jgi:hypothetical protein
MLLTVFAERLHKAFSDTYQVWINKNYHGVIMQTAKGWIVSLQRYTILQGDDVAVIIENG